MRHPLFYPVMLLLCGALTFSITGCGGDTETPIDDPECTSNEDCQEDGSTMVCNEDGICVPDDEVDVDAGSDAGGEEDTGDTDVETCEDGRVKEEEICDGIDNDCDGIIDNVEGAGDECDTELLGICQAGTMQCVDGNADLECVAVSEPGEEVCDGLDNDCNGEIDNVTGVGDECDTGLDGVCADGVLECDPEGSGELVCTQLNMPSEELCDALDNDCSGLADDIDGIGEECQVPEKLGVCAEGVLTCSPDLSLVPVCVQVGVESAEVCDSLDNNCDGFVDNVPGAGVGCETGLLGVCRQGVYGCDPQGGDELACLQVSFPSEEICDGMDNNCDGTVDTADPLFVTAQCENQQGVCNGAMKPASLCVEGAWAPCDDSHYVAHEPLLYGVEVCDGVDNSCNGLVDGADPNLMVDLCENQVGACQGAVRTGENCIGGVWQACTDTQYIANGGGNFGIEVCDGIDNDCDGEMDNVANLGNACNTGLLGNCATGEWTCEGATGPNMICEQIVFPQEEICDGQDNNCNGKIDADDSELALVLCEKQAGVCSRSTKPAELCTNGFWMPCTQDVYADYSADYGQEVCDGLDNNCDGKTDAEDPMLVLSESCENQKGVCSGAIKLAGLCQNGQWGQCGTADYQARHESYGDEVCDGLDNNCDGLVDASDPALVKVLCENQFGVCHGSLKSSSLCRNGAWEECIDAEYEFFSESYGEEVCNGLDDDCDGVIDNIAPIECGVAITGPGGNLCNMSSRGHYECEPDGSDYTFVCAPYLRLLEPQDVSCGTFTRASRATYIDEQGLLNTAVANNARFQWDETINDEAFLYEGERTNFIANSIDMNFYGGAREWNGYLASVNQNWADDLAVSGDYLSGGTWEVSYEAINARAWNVIGASAVGPYVASFYAKGGSCPGFYVDRFTSMSNNDVYITLTSNWERHIIEYEITSAQSGLEHGIAFRNITRPASGQVVTASLWGVQVENGPFVTSYIPSDATAATRKADLLTYSSDVLRNDMGTYSAWFKPQYNSESGANAEYQIFSIDAGNVLSYKTAQNALVCKVGNVSASLNVSFDESNGWLFVGCSWSPQGVRLFASTNAADSEPTYVFVSGNAVMPANVGGVKVAPIYSLSKDVRIYRRDLPETDITAIFADTVGTFRPY